MFDADVIDVFFVGKSKLLPSQPSISESSTSLILHSPSPVDCCVFLLLFRMALCGIGDQKDRRSWPVWP